jgi:hypothetical protein
MVLNWIPTSSAYFKKPPQAVAETSYGVPPASPTFTVFGQTQQIAPAPTIDLEEIRTLGNADPIANRKLREMHSFSLQYKPFDTKYMKYGVNLANPQSPAGTNAESLTVVWSQLLNNTELYTIATGVKTDTISIEISKAGGVNVTQNFRCFAIYSYKTDASIAGITTPTYVTASPGTVPWSSLQGGIGPLKIEGVVWPTDRFKLDVNQNLRDVDPNGSQSIEYLAATIRSATADFDTWLKDATLLNNFMAGDKVDIEYTMLTDPTTPLKIVANDASFTDRGVTHDAASPDFNREALTARLLTVSLN